MSGKTYQTVFNMLKSTLQSELEAFEVLTYITGLGRESFINLRKDIIPANQLSEIEKIVDKRLAGEPLQYLLGEWEFYGLPFVVGRGVLVPRQDTEALVDVGIELAKGIPKPEILDLCSGSGAVAIAVEKNIPSASVIAVELSSEAIGYLQSNIKLNNSGVSVVKANVFEYLHHKKADLILCNPPYIKTSDLQGLQAEVLKEPVVALDGGEDGLNFYKKIPPFYRNQINSGGFLVFEVGISQHEDVKKILCENGLINISEKKDLTGIVRVVWGQIS